MMFFALVASQGHLIAVPGTMSCYRTHASGLTRTSLYAGSNDHRLRILMWTSLVRFLGGRGQERAHRVCDDLLADAVILPVARGDAFRWFKAACARPSFFFARRQRIRRLMQLLRRGIGASDGARR